MPGEGAVDPAQSIQSRESVSPRGRRAARDRAGPGGRFTLARGMEGDVITRARSLGARAVTERPARTAFIGVFVAALLTFLGLGVVLPVLPRYVKGPIGADDFAVGVVTGAFALTAVLCRPVSGRIASRSMSPIGIPSGLASDSSPSMTARGFRS